MEATDERSECNELAGSGNPIWIWFGLDVSKESFTAARFHGLARETFRPKEKSFPLDKKGVAGFLKWRKSFDNGILTDAVAMEATGSYTGKLCRLLLADDPALRVSVCNPFATSLYTKSFTPAKTDGTDAEYIARSAATSPASGACPTRTRRISVRWRASGKNSSRCARSFPTAVKPLSSRMSRSSTRI